MQNIIKNRQVISDDWQLLRLNPEGELPQFDPALPVIVPLASWLADVERWRRLPGPRALWLAPEDDPALLLPYLDEIALIAVDFPSFTDGRGYSIGRLLRERYRYLHELRALGDVWQDQLQALWQVGFDSFEIKPGKPLEQSITALESFSDHYQGNYRQPDPWFRRSINSV
jgi:uncharacterized protein (DUF934 family)